MGLDRGVLARIDRRLLAGLDRDERFQMVRVPVTPAKWSTWKRYCDAAGISMGRAIAALIDHELASMFGDSSGGAGSMFEEQAQRRLADREAALTKRGNELSAAEERVRLWSEHLRRHEHEIEVRECRVEAATKLPSQPAGAAPRPVATNAARVGRASSTSTATAYQADDEGGLPDSVLLAPTESRMCVKGLVWGWLDARRSGRLRCRERRRVGLGWTRQG